MLDAVVGVVASVLPAGVLMIEFRRDDDMVAFVNLEFRLMVLFLLFAFGLNVHSRIISSRML